MLKTPAALLGLFGGDEMYVVKPGMTDPVLAGSTYSVFTAEDDLVLLSVSPYSGADTLTVTFPNGKTSYVSVAKATTVKLSWPIPKGSTLRSNMYQLNFTYVPLVPAKSVGGVKTLIRRIANATFKGGLRDATREENVARGGRQHIDGSLRSTSLVSNRIRNVHHRRRANYHTYKPYHSQCADIRNVHSELPEVHVGDTRQNQRVLSLIRPLFRCGKGEKLLGGNGPSGSGVRGFAVASGMNLRGLRLKEAA